MLIKNLRTPIAVAALLTSVLFTGAARAQLRAGVVRVVVDSSGHLVRGTVNVTGDIVDTTGRVVGHEANGTIDTTGNIVDLSGHIIGHVSGDGGETMVVSDTLSSTIDSRRFGYDQMIADALANNRINSAQAAEYRATLQRVATDESNYLADNILTYAEATTLASQLDSFGGTLYTVANVSPWSPLLVTGNGVTRITVTPTYYAPVASTTVISSSPSSTTTTTTTSTSSFTTVGAPAVVSAVVSTNGGGLVRIGTASPELYVTTIETRRKDLDRLIDRARDSGQITGKQADVMKSEIRRIAHETGSNTISYSRAVMLAEDLDLIGNRLGTVVTTGGYVPIIQGSHFTVYNGTILQLDDLSVRRADLEARITKDYLEGRLTDSQTVNLRAQLDAIGTTAAVYRETGGIDFKESKALYRDFDHVASEIERYAGKDNN